MDADAFWSRVDKTGECWLWTGFRNRAGYGQCSWGLAHRVAYRLVKGAIPEGLYLLHSCDNPPCVNPNHLTPGTAAENSADMSRKGRGGKRYPGTDRDIVRRQIKVPAALWMRLRIEAIERDMTINALIVAILEEWYTTKTPEERAAASMLR